MHDSPEPSYYEIALTNRQVLVFFVVLLLSVVGAFFSGVWLGQQRAGEMPRVARAAEPQATDPSDEELDELNFFTDEERSKGAAGSHKTEEKPSIPAAGSPETTLVEDVGDSEVAAAPVDPPRPATPIRSGGYVIQVFSSPDGGQARKLLERLESGGYEAFLSPVEVDGRTMHRVRIGPFADKGSADQAALKVGEAFRVDTWVTRNE